MNTCLSLSQFTITRNYHCCLDLVYQLLVLLRLPNRVLYKLFQPKKHNNSLTYVYNAHHKHRDTLIKVLVVIIHFSLVFRMWDISQPVSPLIETITHHHEFTYGLSFSSLIPGRVSIVTIYSMCHYL